MVNFHASSWKTKNLHFDWIRLSVNPFLTWGFKSFWKWGNIRRRLRWNRRLRLFCTLWIRVSRKLHVHLTLMFQLRYYNMMQLGIKSWFQLLQEFEQLQTISGKSKKFKFDGILSKKYIPSAKTYAVDLSNITFKQLLVCRFTKLLMSFLKP